MGIPDNHAAEWELEALRPVRHPVRSGDQFFFMHIPKTAGTTMIEIFQQFFPGDTFFSVPAHEQLAKVVPPMQHARMVRAHRPYSFLDYFARRPIVVTMLRQPHNRMLSNYSYLGRVNQERMQKMGRRARGGEDESQAATFEEFASLPAVRNLQTQYVSGIRLQRQGQEQEMGALMLEVAKARLDSMAFFGLVERFDESMALLSYTFNWQQVKPFDAQNVSPKGAKPSLTPSVQAALEDANRLDMALYEYAAELFDFRLEQMAKGR